MTEFQILSAIRNKGGSVLYTELLSLNLTDPKPDPRADKHRLQNLISDGYISGNLNAYGTIHMEPKGTARLDFLLQQRKQKRKQTKAEAAKERKQIHFSLASAVIGAVLCKLVEIIFPLILGLF